MNSITLDPILTQTIRISLDIAHSSPQFSTALDKAVRNLPTAAAHFDPATHTLTIGSVSEPGVLRTTDGADCDCPGGRHAHCWHRAAWSLIVALEAIRDPFALLTPTAYALDSDVYADAP